MEGLVKQRAAIKSKLTIFSRFVDKLLAKTETLTDVELIQLEQRVSRVNIVMDEFDKVQEQIECIAEDKDVQLTERETFENSYFEKTAAAQNLLLVAKADDAAGSDNKTENDETYPETNPINPRVGNNINLSYVKLPTVPLPKFNGDYQNWLEFRDSFESMIHSNSDLGDIQKFHYLRAALEGGAAQVIRSLEFTSANYVVAWETVKERYNNTRLLVHNHVKALFNLDTIQRESSEKLRKLIDDVSKHLRSLEQLHQPTNYWDTLMIHIITTKLDAATAREWEKFKSENEIPTLDNLKWFLKGRADLLETLGTNNYSERVDKRSSRQTNTKGFFSAAPRCAFCKRDHYIYNCPDFGNLSVNERIEKVKKLKLCTNCLRTGHFAKTCRYRNCQKCNSKHNTLLHIEDAPSNNESNSNNASNVALSSCTFKGQVLLSTVLVNVLDDKRLAHSVRALLDSGSQSSFVTTDLCKRLNLNVKKVNMSVAGLNLTTSNIKGECEIKIESRHNAYSFTINCLLLPEITGNLPNIELDKTNLDIPKNIKLADPGFNEPGKIELLIGADLFWNLLCVGQIKLGPQKPILQKTRLGWIVSGPIVCPPNTKVYCNLSTNSELHDQLARFWELEECAQGKSFSKEEILCEEHFTSHTTRTEGGRFVVYIPFKSSTEALGDSRDMAKRRFLSLERKLNANSDFKKQYVDFINEYIALGHMTELENEASVNAYYMPHHGVHREESITTKLRVVFDASAPSSTGVSLNDLQMVGPTIQQDLLSIILRFRKHAVVVSADIAKMYRQVLIAEEHRKFQRILWRSESNERLRVFELNTVTYGTAAASFLAIRSLCQLAYENREDKPDLSKIIENDFYVDDLLTGASTVEEAALLCKNISDILRTAGFELRKFYSNQPNALKYVKGDDNLSGIISLGENENSKTLGLKWRHQSDELLFNILEFPKTERVTKRTILSSIAQIFDPLGILGPCTIVAKLVMQKLWLERVTWDEALPLHIHTKWIEFREKLPELNKLRIQRHVTCTFPTRVELHGFSDASERAYAACIYLLSHDKHGNCFVNLLCSKSKVAPLKTITLPRLELCGALILSRLAKKVVSSMDMSFDKCVFWSDSSIVLSWLKTAPNLLKVFVSNRVAEIQNETSPHSWRHVPTKQNPADLLSRGLNPIQLMESALWWHGPNFLLEDESNWPILKLETNEVPELRNNVQSFSAVHNEYQFPFERFSKFSRLNYSVAYMLRFINNCQSSKVKLYGPLSVQEIDNALRRLIIIAQRESFSQDFHDLQMRKTVKPNSKLLSLHPFLDSDGIIRVGGRLANSEFSFSKKYPAVLSSKHYLTKLMFIHEHLRLLHAGPQLILSSLRERIWPIAGRNLAKQTVRQCVQCFRHNAKLVQPVMGNLPKQRLQPNPPFSTTGVDYAGPVLIKNKRGRGSKTIKSYICIFICFAVKAVHLELVTDLTKEAFLLAMKRFVARRGKPSLVYSDNGTNFVGAHSELEKIRTFIKANESDLVENFARDGIEWKFIPPGSPHFGGLWEAGVKSSKHHLKRVIGNASLTFEELYTLLAQVECVLNSRPLSPMSADPNDMNPLTPAHFLMGRSATTIPEPDMRYVSQNRLTRYQLVSQLHRHFWDRWSKEYISELQQRHRWKQTQGELQEGTMVLVKEDNTPPLKWRLGRVVRLHPGKDSISRVATIRTSAGEIRRTFSKICPLPLE